MSELDKNSYGKDLAISLGFVLLVAIPWNFSLFAVAYDKLDVGTGMGLIMSTPFVALLVMIPVALVVIYAVRRKANHPFLYGLITAFAAYVTVWIVVYGLL